MQIMNQKYVYCELFAVQGCTLGATDVTALASLLSGPLCGKDCPLAGRTVKASRTSSAHSSKWLTVTMWPHQAEVSYQNALAGLFSLVLAANRKARNTQNDDALNTDQSGTLQGRVSVKDRLIEGPRRACSRSFQKVQKLLHVEREEAIVCTVQGAGTLLRDGVLHLTRSTAVVLDRTCRDVQFRDIKISGKVH
jgi:hypothetical protein